MNTLKIITIIFFLIVANAYGQMDNQRAIWENDLLNNSDLLRTEYKNEIVKYDFSSLWTNTENSGVYGFIGNNYQRLRVKIISAVKDRNNPDTYFISGKSKVKNNICQFTGTIKITKSRIYKNIHWGVDDEYKNQGIQKQGIIIAKYNFAEDKTQKGSGVFDGILFSSWFIDKNGNLKYDKIRFESDSYDNNQFLGTWKSYKTGVTKTANWGDYRIPLSGDLDIGVGEFSPDEKYMKFGWQTYRDAYLNNDKQARKEEERQWWK